MPLLNIFGQLETLIADHLYPYRYAITPLVIAAGLAFIALAVRAGLHLVLWRHRTASIIAGTPLLVLAVIVGNYLVSPLWERSRLVEASPLASASMREIDAAPAAPMAAAMQPLETHRGQFAGADDFHFGRGNALVIKTASGGNVLRFENFSVRNGPDLYVYLSKDASGKRVDEMLNLGRLKATDGAFNYEIPSNIDLTDVKSVVVWCKQFSTLFAAAPLKTS
ncbi:MAG TPA: DM13 domain-containing protein [Dehalococcoidia bacterium]|nr:DM13 domain-containing protein [Dehalococcoidia bacterium]